MIRECQSASHFNEENGKKWSVSSVTSCEGNTTRQIACSGIYGTWENWTTCDKSCVNKNQQSIRTRQRQCNDNISSGKILKVLI